MKALIIVLVVLLILGLAYYFLIYKKSDTVTSGAGYNLNTSTGATGTSSSAPFNPGDDVYVIPLRASYMYLYSYPNNNSANEVGRITNALSGADSIGKFVAMAGNGNFVRVKFNGIVEKKTENPSRPGSYTYVNTHISGEYFVPAYQVQNTPY